MEHKRNSPGNMPNPRYLVPVGILVLAFFLHSISVVSFRVNASGQLSFDSQLSGASQEGSKDVAVTSIIQVGPPFTNEGALVTIQVGVSNNGSSEETFSVELHDDTESVQVARTDATLAGGASSTVNLVWDTTGASGGPQPPGPPTPGTIHELTATAVLEGDNDSANNSMSLLPGIWIIAAPTAPKITYPETSRAPQVDYGPDLLLNRPAVLTRAEPLSKAFFGTIHGQAGGTMSAPDLATEGEPLGSVFSSVVDQSAEGSSAVPALSTAKQLLSRIFRPGISSESEAVLANPGIATIAVDLTRIVADQVHASAEDLLAVPGISTEAEPLTKVLVDHSTTSSSSSLAGATIATLPEPLTGPFASKTNAEERVELSRPDIVTEAEPLTQILADSFDARRKFEGSQPLIGTLAVPSTNFFVSPLEADSSRTLAASEIVTLKEPLSAIYPGPANGTLGATSLQPALTTRGQPLSEIFVGGGAATFRPSRLMENPLEGAEIRGQVMLQRTRSSLGAYVEVGDEVAFVSREGHFTAAVPTEPFDLRISAPGHLPVVFGGISLGPGQTLTLPPVTLLFGDGDGDNVVDILDLSIAAFNYGESTRHLRAP